MSEGLEFIWRKGNVGTKHVAVTVRTSPDSDGKSVLKGFMTLTPDELELLYSSFADPRVTFREEKDKRRHEVDRGATPEHIHPEIPFSRGRKKKT